MATHDYVINDNVDGEIYTIDLNVVLQAILTLNSNTTAPTATAPGMLWLDTTNNVIKQRNTGDSAWNTLWPMNNAGGWLLRNAGNPQGGLAAWFTGQLCWDSTNSQLFVANAADGTIGGTTWTNVLTPLVAYNSTARAVYSSATQFTVASIGCLSSDRAANILKATSTTVDVATTGLNGIAQSANLAGTASCSGTTVTGTGTAFLTDFVAGDVIWFNGGAARRITNVGGNTTLTVESSLTQSATTYRRGGRAPNTWYNLYAITDGLTPGLILSPRNVAGGQSLVSLPSGYTRSRQLPFAARLDASSNLLPWHRIGEDGWVLWDLSGSRVTANATVTIGNCNILNGGTASSFTAVSAADFAPPISRRVRLNCHNSAGNNTYFVLRPTGSSQEGIVYNAGEYFNQVLDCATNVSQSLEYKRSFFTGNLILDVLGWLPTEVN